MDHEGRKAEVGRNDPGAVGGLHSRAGADAVLAAVGQASLVVHRDLVVGNTEHTHHILLQEGAVLRGRSVVPVVVVVHVKNCKYLPFGIVLWKPNVCKACDRHCGGEQERHPCLAVLERVESDMRHHDCNFLVVSSADKGQWAEQEHLLGLQNGKTNTSRLNCICPFPNGGMESQPWIILFVSSPEQPVRDRPFEEPEGKRGVARMGPNALEEEEEEGGNADFDPTIGHILLG